MLNQKILDRTAINYLAFLNQSNCKEKKVNPEMSILISFIEADGKGLKYLEKIIPSAESCLQDGT